MLAQGPEPLLRAYEQVLYRQQVPCSFLLSPVKRRRNVPEDKPLRLLLIKTSYKESSYYIAEELEVSRSE